jgi:flagellar FliL protein
MSDEKKEAAAPKKGKKGLILIAVAAVALLGGGGGAAWYFLKPAPDDAAHAEAQPAPKKSRVFSNLEPFTVNLADEGGERFAQITMVLEVADAKVGEQISANMPAVRNAVLLLLSSKQSRELLTVPGKERLAREVAEAAGRQIGWAPSGDDDGDAPPRRKPVSDGTAADPAAEEDEDEEPKKKRRKKARKPEAPNPVQSVHFAQFIVQ